MAFTLKSLEAGRKVLLKHGIVAAQSVKNPLAPVINEFKTDQEFELIKNATGFGFAQSRDELGASIEQNRRVLYQVMVTPYNYTLKWKSSWESKNFEQYAQVAKNEKLAGIAVEHTVIRAQANIFNNGFVTAGPDGVSLFNATHPTNGGPTYSNLSTAAALSESTVQSAKQQLLATTDPDGKKMMMELGYYLIVPPQLAGAAQVIVKSQNKPGTDYNDYNVAAEDISVIVHPYLIDTNAWFLVPKDKSRHTISQLNRQPLYYNMMKDVEGDMEHVMGREWAHFWEHGYMIHGNEGA